jgi:hypothetical protein
VLHNSFRSGTEKALDSAARRARSWNMVRHPSTGQNLLMTGTDLLDAPTGTPVTQRSEGGQGILGVTEGKGMWVWSAMVLAVLSSRMWAGGCSLAGRRDNVPCLAITAIFKPQNESHMADICHGEVENSFSFFSPSLQKTFSRGGMEGTCMKENFLMREIEDHPVVSSLCFIRAIGRDKAGYRANLRCGCKQVGPVRMSSKRPTLQDCLRELGQLIQQRERKPH